MQGKQTNWPFLIDESAHPKSADHRLKVVLYYGRFFRFRFRFRCLLRGYLLAEHRSAYRKKRGLVYTADVSGKRSS